MPRIEIVSEGSCGQRLSFFGNYIVSRTKPAELNNYLNDLAWNQFCDEIDMKLKSGLMIRKCLAWMSSLSLVATAIYMFLTQGFSSYTDPDTGNPNQPVSELPFGAISIISVSASINLITVFVNYTHWKNIKNEIKQVLQDTSLTQPNLTFTLVERTAETGEIGQESTVNPTTPCVTSWFIDITINNPSGVTTANDTKSRLEELENAKHLLTDQEYADKRSEILSTV